MPFYYHLTERDLAVGDIIEPGNYGRIVMQIGAAHPAYRREMTYEAIRATYFPDRPSRLSCLFCFVTIEEATTFRVHIQGFKDSILYEVVSDEENPLVADANNALLNLNLPSFDPKIVAWYWRGWSRSPDPKAVIMREALLRGPAVVIRKV